MLAGCVVENKVNDDLYLSLMSLFEKILEIFHCSVFGIDGVIIQHIVAMIRRRWVDRHEPNCIDSKFLQVIQFFGDAVEVADSVPVCIVKGADKNFVEDRVAPPLG